VTESFLRKLYGPEKTLIIPEDEIEGVTVEGSDDGASVGLTNGATVEGETDGDSDGSTDGATVEGA